MPSTIKNLHILDSNYIRWFNFLCILIEIIFSDFLSDSSFVNTFKTCLKVSWKCLKGKRGIKLSQYSTNFIWILNMYLLFDFWKRRCLCFMLKEVAQWFVLFDGNALNSCPYLHQELYFNISIWKINMSSLRGQGSSLGVIWLQVGRQRDYQLLRWITGYARNIHTCHNNVPLLSHLGR